MVMKTYQTWGLVTLINTKQYPFNNSVQTIALDHSTDNPDYIVQTEVAESSGEVGDIIISDKAVNGFKIAFRGSAARVVIRYYIIGGLENDSK
jgi:hypothetical protein